MEDRFKLHWPLISNEDEEKVWPPEIVHVPHLDSNMATPFAICSSANMMEAQTRLVKMVRNSICAFKALEVIPIASLNNKGQMVVKWESLVTEPKWCVYLKFIPLDVPLKPFQVAIVSSQTLALASLCAAVTRGLSRGTAKMRSSTTLRSPCKVWVMTDLHTHPKVNWKIHVLIPPHFVKIRGEPGYTKKQQGWHLTFGASRETKGTTLWSLIEEAAYETIEGRLTEDWEENCWHIDSLFRGNHYDATLPLYSLGMSDGCTINVVNQKNHRWTVFFKCPDGSTAHTHVYFNDSASSLHERIVTLTSEKMPIPASEMYTSYGSKLLEYSNAKLWQLGMHNGSTVVVNVRLRGGICVPYSGNFKRKKNQVIVM